MKKLFIISLLFLLFISPSFAVTKSYDGIWFMGFNMNKDIFGDKNGKLVRHAFSAAVNRQAVLKIMGEDIMPNGIIPSGMMGYDPQQKSFKYNVPAAKKLMRQAGYPVSDKRLKSLVLLHTDGDKTVVIANLIKLNLIALGVNVVLKEVPFKYQDMWADDLKSGKYHMFLLGYKTASWVQDDLYPISKADNNPYDIVSSIFSTKRYANFMNYSNPKVDSLLNFVQAYDPASKEAISGQFKQINSIVSADYPVLNLFYISKL